MPLFRNYVFLAAAMSVLNACSSAVFPDVVEENRPVYVGEVYPEGSTAKAADGKVIRPMPQKGSVLVADDQNVAYEEDEEVKPNNFATELSEEKIVKPVAAKTVPVIKETPSDVKDVSVADNLPEPQETALAVLEDMSVVEENNQPSVSYRAETIYFANGSAAVDASYNASLRRIAKEAKAAQAKVKVLGYASSRTRNTDMVSHKLANFKVSLERAQNVANVLRRAGLSASAVEVEALSDSAPVYQEVMPEGERLNRRAEVYILY